MSGYSLSVVALRIALANPLPSNQTPAAHAWSSNLAFVLVAAGTAVGLGNLWRFPFLAGQYGGGAFVLVYIAAVIIIGMPIIIAELAIGRRGRASPGEAVRTLSKQEDAHPVWATMIGWLSLIIPLVGIGYYSVVAGWVVDYTATFIFSGGFGAGDVAAFGARFDAMLASPGRIVFGHTAFMVGVVFVMSLGVRNGIEVAAKILMPLLFILVVGLAVYASIAGDFARAANFLFAPDFTKLTLEGVVAAVGQAFFSLAIGLGALMTFGSYLPKETSLVRSAAGIAAADTGVALIAGLAIFPIVFALGIDPASGPGLIFVTMPAAFAAMPGGYFVGSAFFVLLFAAAFTTAVGTLEAVVVWVERRGHSRRNAALIAGAGAWAIGVIAALSYNVLSGVRPLGFLAPFADKSIFDVLDYAIATLFLPTNGLLAALFAGWAMSKAATHDEIATSSPLYTIWRVSIRYAAPLAIIVILVSSLAG